MKQILVTNKSYFDGDAIALERDHMKGVVAWLDGEHGEEIILGRAIKNVLGECAHAGKGIAFDVRAFGELGYRFSYIDNVFEEIAFGEGREYAAKVPRAVFFNAAADAERLEALGEKLLRPLEIRIPNSFQKRGDLLARKFQEYVYEHTQIPFGDYLMSLAKSKGVQTRSQICMASGISKYTLSKLINGITRPSKDSLAALAIGLKLTLPEAEEMCNQVGYHLGAMDIVDMAVRFFITEGIYDIDEVNYCLYCHGLEPLGEKPRDDKIERDIDWD